MEYSNGLAVGSVATYRCYLGYTVSVSNTRMCGADGEWSGSEAQCTSKEYHRTHNGNPCVILCASHAVTCVTTYLYTAVVDCMSPSALTNGTVDTSRGTTYQAVAVYQCDEGYTLQGQAITACLDNGTWSGPTPTCAREWPTELRRLGVLGRLLTPPDYS